MIYLASFLFGIVAGLRAMTAPAALCWAAHLGRLQLGGSALQFLTSKAAAWVTTLLAAGEFVTDQLPSTPSRKVPVQFAARVVSGSFCGFAAALPSGSAPVGAVLGAVGAVVGTLAGAEARQRASQAIGATPAACAEDVLAVLLAWGATCCM